MKCLISKRCLKLLDNIVVDPEGDKTNSHTRKKPLPATYEPDKRTAAWLKLKKDYVSGVGDSLDLVPVGAWYGNGRKVKWWSPILMAVYDQSSGRFVAVCKCMSGALSSFLSSFHDPLTQCQVSRTVFTRYGSVGYLLDHYIRLF